VAAAGGFAWWWPVGLLFAATFFFVMNFFRDPARRPEGGENALISPADGKVVEIATAAEVEHIPRPALKIAVFMNLFDVHVNRAPCAGRVEWVRHVPGKFLNAIGANAALENEHTLVALRDGQERPVLVKLIAGLIARRIVCPAREGEQFARGQRIGMIKFGSRVEVFLPKADNFTVRVRLGDTVRAGKSILGEWR